MLTTPMTASGQYCGQKSEKSAPSMKLPRRMIRKYRSGSSSVMYCTIRGMLAIGVAKPERTMAGTMKRKTPNSPCCCVTAKDEIISPIPTVASKKQKKANIESQNTSSEWDMEPKDGNQNDKRSLDHANQKPRQSFPEKNFCWTHGGHK